MTGGSIRQALAVATLLLAMSVPFVRFGTPAAAQGWEPRQAAELQMLDKVTARVSTLRATVGQPARFGALSILVLACNARPQDEVPDAAAFLEIRDARRPGGATASASGGTAGAANGSAPGPASDDPDLAFRGWLFANAPGVNMLEHPVYDVRVLDCR